jgi:hypothetical protein
MTNDQIRLHFGELNASEMRLARAIVGWFEHRQAQLNHDWADTDTAVRETCRKAGLDVDGTPAHVPDIPDLVERLAAENAKLRAAADWLAESLEGLINHGHADDCLYLNRANEACDCGNEWAQIRLAAYQATKP